MSHRDNFARSKSSERVATVRRAVASHFATEGQNPSVAAAAISGAG